MQNQNQKNYAPLIRSKLKEFDNGGAVINLSFKVEDITAWMKENRSGDYVNLVLQKRKTPSEKNEFSLTLDTWKPKNQESGTQPAPQAKKSPIDDSDVPPF